MMATSTTAKANSRRHATQWSTRIKQDKETWQTAVDSLLAAWDECPAA
jgi:hypothetical protein